MPAARKKPSHSSLAGDASERVRAIVEAAEAAATDIRQSAEAEAERIRRRAEEEASGLRSRVRTDAQALLGSIRESVDRLRADLERLEERLGEPAPADDDPDVALAEDAAVGLDEPEPVAGAPAPDAPVDADRESARLVALNMALDGTSRDEVDRYLSENFQLSDRQGLLDEVYSRVGG